MSERLHKFFLKHTSTWFDARRVAIIGFGNVGLYIAALLLKDGYSVMVCDFTQFWVSGRPPMCILEFPALFVLLTTSQHQYNLSDNEI